MAQAIKVTSNGVDHVLTVPSIQNITAVNASSCTVQLVGTGDGSGGLSLPVAESVSALLTRLNA